MSEQDGHQLVLSFAGLDFGETSEQAFVYGVEFGQLWERMKSGREAQIEQAVHSINRVVIERACAADGWTVEFEDESDGWILAKLNKISVGGGNPRGLRVVN